MASTQTEKTSDKDTDHPNGNIDEIINLNSITNNRNYRLAHAAEVKCSNNRFTNPITTKLGMTI